MDKRAEAWGAVHEALSAGWRVGLPSFDPAGDGHWSVSAIDARSTGRGKVPQSVTGSGDTEEAALHDLDDRLRGVPRPNGGQMDALRRRLRLAYIAGAEEWTRGELGRGMTGEELEGVTARYTGR
jgi:hypothetical protein